MRRSLRRRLQGQDMEFEIAPLVDMVFLLLLFFVVSTTFRGQPGIKIDLPRAASIPEEVPEFVEITITSDDVIHVGNNVVASIEDLGPVLQIQANESRSKMVYVRADRNTRHGVVVQVIDMAKRAGFREATVATMPVQTRTR